MLRWLRQYLAYRQAIKHVREMGRRAAEYRDRNIWAAVTRDGSDAYVVTSPDGIDWKARDKR